MPHNENPFAGDADAASFQRERLRLGLEVEPSNTGSRSPQARDARAAEIERLELEAQQRRFQELTDQLNRDFAPGRSLALQSSRFREALTLTRGLRLAGLSSSGFVDPDSELGSAGRSTILTGRLRGTKLTRRGVRQPGLPGPFTSRAVTSADTARDVARRRRASGRVFDPVSRGLRRNQPTEAELESLFGV